MKLADKLRLGAVHQLGSHTFGADEIVAFASRYDPQAFHLSEEGAAASHFGRLCASGWHTVAMWMRHNVSGDRRLASELEAVGEAPVEFGPALGLKNVRWLTPVYCGDTISFDRSFLTLRDAKARPGWSIAEKHCEAHNQNGVKVLSFDSAMMLRDKLGA